MTEAFDRKLVQAVVLDFQTPSISVNAIYRAFARGRRVATIKSEAYRDFIKAAGAELEAQSPGCVAGKFGLTIKLAKSCRIDADNTAKAWLDLLQLHGVVDNDRHCRRLLVEYSDHDVTQLFVISTKGAEQ